MQSYTDGWKATTVTIDRRKVPDLKPGVSFTLEIDYVDLEWHLEHKWFGNPKYKPGFVLEATRKFVPHPTKGLVRDFTEPQNAEAWLSWQESARSAQPQAVIAPFQLYSDKALVNNKLKSVHPVKFSLLNVAYSLRMRSLETVAYIPVLDRPPHVSIAVWRLVKLSVHSSVLELLLDPLKRLSAAGKMMKDPNGVQRLVVPRFASYVVDAPEGADMMMIKGVPSQHPCEVCLVSKDNLGVCDHRGWTPRTEAEAKQNYERLRQRMNATARAKLSVELSTQPVACAAWGFKDQDQAGWGSIMRIMGYESMHQEELGVFLYIIIVLPSFLTSCGLFASGVLRKMNERMAMVPHSGM